ncbi:MAG: xanthine dehydrogenase family protein molybdopterin-binding subunit, partial [Sterolibacterium sp.]|nr:xanthine dehydrogenase family protein molybdopterin-binding subunit [Sterolibacterium sp.]
MSVHIPTLPEQMPTSAVRYVGKEVKRVEDPSLVTGTAPFIDNIKFPNMLQAAILRSPHPHARIVSINTKAAEALPGVYAVLTGADVKAWSNPCTTAPEGWGNYCMAVDKVRFVGEPVAAVAAENRYLAEDALELIEVEYEVLPALATPQAAMAAGAPVIFEQHGSNVIQQKKFTWGEIDVLFDQADHVIRDTFRWNRCGANPTETFGCICIWDVINHEVTCHGAYQAPRFFALGRAANLNLLPNKVKLISYPQGGGFGGKGGPRGTDIAALLSRKADGRPVKYIEDRMEYLLAGGGQAWDRHYEAELAVKADGTLMGLRVKLIDDQGAGCEGYGTISVAKPIAAFTGPYRIQAASYDTTIVATNRAPTYPYRGYGPPPHFFVLESLVDLAARKLGADPAELRRRNYIAPEQFPYTIPSGNEYDSGRYEVVLDKLLDMAGYRKMREEQAAARAAGRLVGVGLVSTVEPGVFDWNVYSAVGVPGVGVPEGARVAVDVFGGITIIVGFNLQGQGQYTVASQVAADYFGVDIGMVKVTMASTDVAPPHFGPGGSRLGVAITGAILGACDKLRGTFSQVVAGLMQTTPDQIELMDGRFRLKAMPEHGMT